jgi:xanthine dehydrogenase accessory factor
MTPPRLPAVLVIGGGELGSAVAHRLARAGMHVAVADLERPTCIRRQVCFAEALAGGTKEVEGVVGLRASSAGQAREIAATGRIAVLAVSAGPTDYARLVSDLGVEVVVDARMLKRNEGISSGLAPLVIGLGPGFKAPGDAHVVIETNRGHNLGRVISSGEAEADTGEPGEIGGYSSERVIRAPDSGVFASGKPLGTVVARGDVVGRVGGVGGVGGAEVAAPIAGLLRGLVADGVAVECGRKIGDVDPRGAAIDVSTISDKGRAVAGGVLEAIMQFVAKRG